MKVTIGVLLGALLFFSSSARATTIRSTSGYGEPPVLSVGGSSSTSVDGVTISEQELTCANGVTCPAASDNPADGNSEFPLYIFLYQVDSTASNFTLTLSGVTVSSDFSDGTTSDNYYGIFEECVNSTFTTCPATQNFLYTEPSNPLLASSGSAVTATLTGTDLDFTVSGTSNCADPSTNGCLTFFVEELQDSAPTVESVTPIPTPEPASLALLTIGLLSLAFFGCGRAFLPRQS